MRHGSLFSGIGGFDLASEWMGWQNVFHCEIEPFCQKVLKYHFPNSILHENIKETDFTKYRGTVDIISGGFPCQPYSVAGKRKGKEDDRHLWPEMLRAIQEIQPTWIVGENVSGLISWNGGMVFDEVQTDLEAEGYEVIPFILPAASVNAPHKRDRIWFIAYSDNIGKSTGFGTVSKENGKVSEWNKDAEFSVSNTKSVTDSKSNGRKKSGQTVNEWEVDKFQDRNQIRCEPSSISDERNVTNSDSRRQPGKEYRKDKPGQFTEKSGTNHWQNFPTQSPVCYRDDGISDRLDGITFPKWKNESIKAAGNAIVPQVAYQIFKAIEQFEKWN